ncbi:MAG: methyl-accepting chemotaxis protein [Actinomycetota bacterium]
MGLRWNQRQGVSNAALLADLQLAITQTAVGAARSSVSLDSLGRRLDESHGRTAAASESIATIADAVHAISDRAATTRELAVNVDDIAASGIGQSDEMLGAVNQLAEIMGTVEERLQSLEASMSDITEMTSVIDGIANQTRLLALNASIEAVRAGEHGRGFAVVAEEVGTLAGNTAEQTSQITGLVQSVVADIEAVAAGGDAAIELVSDVSSRAASTGEALHQIAAHSRQGTEHMGEIAAAVQTQASEVDTVRDALRETVTALGSATGEATSIASDTRDLSTSVERAFQSLEAVRLDTIFHRSIALARELAERTGSLLAEPVDGGRCRLDQVLGLDYRPIEGSAIRSLSRLFDVSRVPSSGFEPPKYATAYDALVDAELQTIEDDILAREPQLIFALVMDLNSYAPIHNATYCKDWTGDPDLDLVGNRVKRFFAESVLLRGSRVGLSAERLPTRAARSDFEQAGLDLREPDGGDRRFLVQTYARDTGAIVTVLAVPVYVKGHRWGAAILGWNEDGAR